MSRNITQTSSSSSAVAAGSSVVVPVNTTTGFSAGDYVYTTPTGIGTRATGNVNIGSDTPYVGTTWISTGLQSVAFRSASYGPLIDQATFSGTTRTFGQNMIAANTVKATYSYHNRTCTLANGNVVLMYNTGANLFFKIIDSTGATVLAETTLTSSLYTASYSGNFACCTLVSGNIQFIWNQASAYQLKSQQFTQAGSAVSASFDVSSPVSNLCNISMAALSGGGSVFLGASGNAIIYSPYYGILNSAGVYTTGGGTSYGVGGGGQYYVQVAGLPSSYGTNIWTYVSQDANTNTGYYPVCGVYSGSTAVTSANLTAITGVSGGETFNMTIASDGTICASVWNGSIYCYKLTYTKSTNTTGSLAVGTYTYVASGSSGTLCASSNGAVICIAHTGNDASVSKLTSANVLTGPTNFVTGVIQSSGTGNPGAFCGASFGSGIVSALYVQTSTSYTGQAGGASIAATNGSTVLTGSSYTPSQGYYLMGVAATDAAANQTGQVIVNGTAQLGSAYPTVTTPIYYSYQTTASQPIFGQRGVVNATTVTLKGLEA